MSEDILIRMQAKVIGPSQVDPLDTVVELQAREFYECLNEVIRLRAKLEEIAETLPSFITVKRLQAMAREGVMPDE